MVTRSNKSTPGDKNIFNIILKKDILDKSLDIENNIADFKKSQIQSFYANHLKVFEITNFLASSISQLK